jgi:hypothetical protein
MANFIGNIRNSFADTEVREADRGDLVQTIVITALLAVAAILVIGWISTTLINKGADVVECIEGTSTYEQKKTTTKTACNDDKTTSNKVTDDAEWTSRFG